jgi:hypothetical protein
MVNKKAFLEGFYNKLHKIASREEGPEGIEGSPRGGAVKYLTGAATGLGSPQIDQAGLAPILKALQDVGRYGPPVTVRQPFGS